MEDESQLVTYERQGRIAVLTLNRPPVHALSLSLYRALARRIDELGEDESVNVAVLTATGRKAFCGGADVKEMRLLDQATRRERHEFVSSVWVKIAHAKLPIVAAINGPAPGGGTVLAGLCDYRIAADEATFSYPEIDRGTTGGGGVFLRMIGVSEGAIRKILYTGRVFAAREALAMGLVDEVVPYERLLPAAMELAGEIASKARPALVLMKQGILAAAAEDSHWEAAYRSTHHLSAQMTATKEAKEGMSAFLEKRAPDYTPRS